MRSLLLAALVPAAALLAACPEPLEPDPEPTGAVTFPDDFIWGTATAQWQIEGDAHEDGPVDSNWRQWTLMGKTDAAQENPNGNGFRTRYAEEAARAKALGLSHFRLGIDWSRVEPEPGVYDDAELDHLVAVLDALRAEGIEPVLTLWHWVVPTWVQNPNPDAPGGVVDLMASTDPADHEYLLERWDLFVRRVLERVKDRVDIYTALNEPFSMISAAYIGAEFPPALTLDIVGGTRFGVALLFMHASAYDAIKELDDVDADADGENSWVGLTQTANAFYPLDPENDDLVFAAEMQSYAFNDWIMHALVDGDLDVDLDKRYDNDSTEPAEGHYPELEGRLDFIGVQYYGPVVIRSDILLDEFHPLYGRPLLDVRDYDDTLPHNGMGREIRASGYRDTLDIYAKWGLPILLTENGTTTNGTPAEGEPEELTAETGPPEPEQAAMYLVEHLWEVGKAIEDGIDIRGYFHWTLSDNFEWLEGRRQRFGAYSVDFDDAELPRTLNPMGEALQEVVSEGSIDEARWTRWTLDRYPSDSRSDSTGYTTSAEPSF
jgi:beta-glucosidase